MRYLPTECLAVLARIHLAYLIQNHDTPFARLQKINHALRLFRAVGLGRQHGVSATDDAVIRRQRLVLRREAADDALVDLAPAPKLVAPLLDGDVGRAQHNRALLDRRDSRHARQRLAGAARQHNNARPRAAAAEHFAEAFFLKRKGRAVIRKLWSSAAMNWEATHLIRPQNARWLEVNINILQLGVLAEVVFVLKRARTRG